MESDSASSQFDPQKEDVSNDTSQVDNDSDPFLTPGSTRRGKKRRRVQGSTKETMREMFDQMQAKRDEEKEEKAAIREEVKEDRKKFLDIMTKNQETISEAVNVFKLMVEKM